MSNQPVIVSAKRTPVGRFMGSLSRTPATDLGAIAIRAVFDEAPQLRGNVDEVLMGNVLQAGVGQNPARQAALKAGMPSSISAMTINKVCGSGLEAVMQAARAIKAGDAHCVIAGGMENMSLAPHYTYMRAGAKFGETKLHDHMQHDGLYCIHEKWGMTNAADYIADKHNVSRDEQDRFSARSHRLASEAESAGHFGGEIVPLTGEQIGNRKKPGPEGGISADEGVRAETTADILANLRTVPGHSFVTAGNASQISDGAAAVAVCSASRAEELGVTPIAKILGYHTHGVDPKDIFEAPIQGIAGALEKVGLSKDEVDLYEINEAFAAQVLCNIKELGLDEDKVNICGGGIAIGHPIGASGGRVLTTLIHQLKRTGGTRGVAALCLGGGNAVAMAVEMV